MSTVVSNRASETQGLRVRLLEILEEGPRSIRTIMALSGSSHDFVYSELVQMQREDLVLNELTIIPVWRITSKGRRYIGL